MRIRLVLTWKKVAGLIVLGIAGALLVGWSGLVSIAASSGHFAITRWFLGWTMENAVETQSMLIKKPEHIELDDPALIRRSAGHYATGCAACHGAPGVPQSPVVEQMTPSPPRLEEKVGDWSDEELFWIVKNGIKYSGMPAWPAPEREDEVWAQVAFLRALPGMTRAEYAELALGGGLADSDVAAGGETTAALDGIVENALADCARCHGRDGLGRGAGKAGDAFPVIAGQPAAYLYATLRAFALGRRESGFMEPPANRYTPEVLEALAQHYAARPGREIAAAGGAKPAATASGAAGHPFEDAPVAGEPYNGRAPENSLLSLESWQDQAGVLEGEGELSYAEVPLAAAAGPPTSREGILRLGRRIALEGIGFRKVPACQSCHGQAGWARNPYYPYLAGQAEWYLSEQLSLWQEGRRGGTEYAHVMNEIARNMTDEQIEAVSAWYSELPEPVQDERETSPPSSR
ncbi:c-type cytochrome [Tranquillimonas alkanivorans]|uniref:Cytochrome c553 n=1 Tax=Tranquillimonas alkanivorans TaxID=441119 RepID=A0A1I5TNP7_9RHOB|nr:c-type cytochrome [Tranquillimonas alkanivorans]SFP84724.1 Cytochrome c553 [Tranquillimonas alkanivorans]